MSLVGEFQLKADAALRLGLSPERVLAELMSIGFANLANYKDLVMGDDDARAALDDLIPEHSAAILELNCETKTNRNRPGEVVHKVHLKLHDKKGALETLGRHMKMWIDKSEVEHTGMIPVVIGPEEMEY
jgi:phage terminase small subunit